MVCCSESAAGLTIRPSQCLHAAAWTCESTVELHSSQSAASSLCQPKELMLRYCIEGCPSAGAVDHARSAPSMFGGMQAAHHYLDGHLISCRTLQHLLGADMLATRALWSASCFMDGLGTPRVGCRWRAPYGAGCSAKRLNNSTFNLDGMSSILFDVWVCTAVACTAVTCTAAVKRLDTLLTRAH